MATEASPGLVDVLQASVKSLEASVGSAFARMGHSLQQSVSMMESMNGMMEEYVTRGLAIGAELAPCSCAGDQVQEPDAAECSGGTRVKVSVTNRTRIPLAEMQVSIRVAVDRNSEERSFEPVADSVRLEALASEDTWTHAFPCTTLKAGAVLEARVSFPSPGTGKTLSAVATTTVKTRDVAAFAYAPEAADLAETGSERREQKVAAVPAQVVREALGINPMDGLSTNSGAYGARGVGVRLAMSPSQQSRSMVDVYVWEQPQQSRGASVTADAFVRELADV